MSIFNTSITYILYILYILNYSVIIHKLISEFQTAKEFGERYKSHNGILQNEISRLQQDVRGVRKVLTEQLQLNEQISLDLVESKKKNEILVSFLYCIVLYS